MPDNSACLCSRSSVDELFELVRDLDDAEVHVLLQDFNNTVPSNISVNQGIRYFAEKHAAESKPRVFLNPVTRSPRLRSSNLPELHQLIARRASSTSSSSALSTSTSDESVEGRFVAPCTIQQHLDNRHHGRAASKHTLYASRSSSSLHFLSQSQRRDYRRISRPLQHCDLSTLVDAFLSKAPSSPTSLSSFVSAASLDFFCGDDEPLARKLFGRANVCDEAPGIFEVLSAAR